MSTAKTAKIDPTTLRTRIRRGLRLVTAPFPYLAGLAAATRFSLDDRVPTMGVFASGRLVVNPAFAAKLNDADLLFVLAHELLHLALRTHDRARGAGRLEFNYAHDYIINDILRTELGRADVPAGGLDMAGARKRSAEEIVLEMRAKASEMPARSRVFDGQPMTVGRALGVKPGDKAQGREEAGDVLGSETEREMFPGEAKDQARAEAEVREAAAKGLALAKAIGALKGQRGQEAGGVDQNVSALRGLYRTPWELALQRWLESVAPGERTFTRPSRRGADRSDIVLPGRRRQGWLLNVVLDTSGSMTEVIPRALGTIADFADTVGLDQVRLVQCDTTVTGDVLVAPEALAAFKITGYGGSDLTPALVRLAGDPAVRSVVVITDGDITYPREPTPYAVLWVLAPGATPAFQPPYGRIIRMQ